MKDLQDIVGEINKANGWHDTKATPVERIALIMTEAAEAIEEIRNGRDVQETYYPDYQPGRANKPEGVPSEIADIVIRCYDFAYVYGIDLDEMITEKLAYNSTRGIRHGGKAL